MTTSLKVSGLSVRYGAVRALTDVSIELTPGVVHGVIGPNGAGKSTLIDALSGRTKPTTGTVELDGTDITRDNPVSRRRNGLSRSFQRTSVFPLMTAREQLAMVARKQDVDDMDDIVAALGLEPVLDQVCREIAYGTQRLVDLALAMIGSPSVVLLDEPCAGLVTAESEVMLSHVRELCKSKNIAVMLVEHDVEGVFRTCDVISVLNLGRLLATGEPSEIRSNPEVVKAYLGSAA